MTALLVAQLLVASGVFHNCPVTGDATSARTKALDALKNRSAIPTTVNPDATLDKVGAYFHDDRTRWKETDAATFEGYAVFVASGGAETANCHATDSTLEDTHFPLALLASTAKVHTVVTEITARFRAAMKAQGVDWSTAALKKLQGKKVRVTGWLMLDIEHVSQSENSHSPGSSSNWRQTAWEIHPVTKIEVVQ